MCSTTNSWTHRTDTPRISGALDFFRVGRYDTSEKTGPFRRLCPQTASGEQQTEMLCKLLEEP